MDRPSSQDLALLDQAMHQARRLLAELAGQQADLEKNPPKIPPADLAAGRAALENAIASARRTVAALQDAREHARQADNLAAGNVVAESDS